MWAPRRAGERHLRFNLRQKGILILCSIRNCVGFVIHIKGSVQLKLRWVENGVIRRVWASYRGSGYYFVVLGGLHLVFTLFPFPVSTAQIISEFWKNRCSGTSDLVPIVLALYSRNR
jgi:hypothetical protein